MNVSQSHYLLITTEYFVDQEKYFYLILLHMIALLYSEVIVGLGIGTMLITYLEHTCGMFKIASYRIEHAVNIDILQNITIKNKILMTKGLIYAVDIHRQAMKLSKHLLSTFEIMVFCITGCVVASFSFNMFQLFQIASSKNNNKYLLLPFIYASISIIYMFIANYIGQHVIDHNNDVYVTAFNVQWYKTPLQVQRIILFLLQRRVKEFALNIGGIFDASIEGFATCRYRYFPAKEGD
ncbi:PREDICTED: uncharacterized protein LOC105460374 [Wasmannia auropunctata]|uniref:uncharacterized protein LOC105460374 n=1 Tax=Wasmannia auropunctata TaxID=64793 RepID=UPI0005EDD4C2|nr:PREDICTED: uncharacterized protein LOC105460374 [Wasmannia auropunctata]